MANKSPSINLIKNTRVDFFTELINWTLTVGRLLVIIIELIALGAFLYRFSLDRRLDELRTDIKAKQTIVLTQKDNETKYRDLQDRLQLASSSSSLSMERANTLKDILGFTPQGMKINSLSLNKGTINITANVQVTSSLTLFVNSLKKHPNIDILSIERIENKPSTNVTVVDISGILKESKYGNI